jgi:hypothetical protein
MGQKTKPSVCRPLALAKTNAGRIQAGGKRPSRECFHLYPAVVAFPEKELQKIFLKIYT